MPVSTIRYYERAGLVTPASRTDSNYRLYDADAIGRLRFIKAAQTAGFTLHNIRALLDLQDGVTSPCAEVRQLLKHRINEIEKTIDDLRDARDALRSLQGLCDDKDVNARCETLNRLYTTSANS